MKQNNTSLTLILLAVILMLTVSCAKKEATPPTSEDITNPAPAAAEAKEEGPVQLPVRFQVPSYFAQDELATDMLEEDTEEYEIKVGANITSTRGPQPLWDILKRLAKLRGMNVSWSSDVDQNVLVDVDISADDSFFGAIDNLLRQVDYFHEVEGNTIVVKYKETKTFNVSIPFMKGNYNSTVGGNFLTDRNAATGTEGTVKVTSSDNPFDVWENIKLNLETILEIWSGRREDELIKGIADKEAQQAARTYRGEARQAGGGVGDLQEEGQGLQTETRGVTRRTAQGYYTIDRSVGLVSVTAPRPMMQKVEKYFNNLKTELYRQVVIEAKIIEVFLKDNSKMGLDWSRVLKDFNISGLVEFGTGGLLGQVYPWNPPDDLKPNANYPATFPDSFIYRVSLEAVPFTAILNALNEQGDTTVLSNPKLTVLNGQPAVISIGTDIAYIKEVSSDVNNETGTVTYTAETDSVVEGIAFGVLASIIDNESVILHLTPVTTDLVNDVIEYREFGIGLSVGLPRVQIREMSTMVQVNNGEMLIIGGLIDSIEAKDSAFAPVVGNIPLVKYLFGFEEKRMEKRELVILLTPKII
ncbi:MAG TPA: pilus (MSHA type) biogenesis protein MshL [Desulfobacteraceae bacterium]|nr:pilus (MSHA type) biogenesis protein MshL [Desulfobacteraceae bacterium]